MAKSQIKRLSHAIEKQNVESLKLLVAKVENSNPYIPEVDRCITSPLHFLIFNCTLLSRRESNKYHKCVEMVNILLSKLQNINEQCDLGRTIFHWIVLDQKEKNSCFIEILKILLPKSNLNLKDCFGKTAFQCAEYFGFTDIVNLFKPWYNENLHLPPMKVRKDSWAWTLKNFQESSDDEDSNDDENSNDDEDTNKDSDLYEKFLKAVEKGDITMVKKLLDRGTPSELLKLDFKVGDKNTALHLACKHGHLKIVKFLLRKGASKNMDMISSAMYYAAYFDENKNYLRILGKLMKHGAIIDFRLEDGETILSKTWVSENKKLLRFLFENGSFDPRWKDTRLHKAAWFGLPDLVKKFLKNGDDPNLKNFIGDTPYDNAKEKYDIAKQFEFDHEIELFEKIMSILNKNSAKRRKLE